MLLNRIHLQSLKFDTNKLAVGSWQKSKELRAKGFMKVWITLNKSTNLPINDEEVGISMAGRFYY